MVEFPWEHHMTYTGKSKHTIKLSGLFLVKPNTRKSIWPPLKSQIVSPNHPWDMLFYSPACISSNKPFWNRSIAKESECCNGSIFCLSKVKVSVGKSILTSSTSTVESPSSLGAGAKGSYPYHCRSSTSPPDSAISEMPTSEWFLMSSTPFVHIWNGDQWRSVLIGWWFHAAANDWRALFILGVKNVV